MPREFSRNRRVADLMQRELAALIQREIRDESLGLLTLSKIDVSPDLKNAQIYFTCLGNTVDVEQVSSRLNEYAGHFRHELSGVLIMRSVPKLQFKYDHTLERANKLTALIDSLHTRDEPDHRE
jgi:ribosome-binding factor A